MAIRVAKLAAYLVGILLMLVLVAAVVIRTSWFQDLVRAQVERAADSVLRGELRVGRLHGSLLRGVQLDDVTLRVDGRDVLVVPSVALHYSLIRLIRQSIVIDRITLLRPAITLIETDNGWNVASLMKTRETDGSSPPSVAIAALAIQDGQLLIDRKPQRAASAVRIPEQVTYVETALSLEYDAEALRLTLKRVSFVSSKPSLVVRDLSGELRQEDGRYRVDALHLQTDRSEMRLSAEYIQSATPATVTAHLEGAPLDVAEWSTLVPALAPSRISPTLTLDARGPL